MKRGQFRGNQVRIIFDMSKAGLGSNRKLCRIIQTLGSKNVPFPCISKLATKAFQWLTEPHPVQVCRFTPARPNAGGMSTAADFPSGAKGLYHP